MKLAETERLLEALMESEVLQLAEVGLGVGGLVSGQTHDIF